ncbi:MAG TPA: class I SAM-dependent methyltransferase [Patescibacteria group bacterium]|nr:class I SAM-dependent methyltransferase [Patescibacteria group bacterium]
MKRLINKLHKSKLLRGIIPTLDYCLQRELSDCESVLDLGCGPSSPLQFCKNIKYSVGVEAFRPYLEESKNKKIHSEYQEKDIKNVDFPENSFDAVILIEVLEHLPEELGNKIIKEAKKWARKKIIVSSPNGFLPQKALDDNPMQAHLSGWDLKKMSNMGFKCFGLAGLKCLRQEVQDSSMGDDMTTTIKYRPRFFWFLVASISQIFVYSIPSMAFELFSVMKKNESDS